MRTPPPVSGKCGERIYFAAICIMSLEFDRYYNLFDAFRRCGQFCDHFLIDLVKIFIRLDHDIIFRFKVMIEGSFRHLCFLTDIIPVT
jgi:hypothetical protein